MSNPSSSAAIARVAAAVQAPLRAGVHAAGCDGSQVLLDDLAIVPVRPEGAVGDAAHEELLLAHAQELALSAHPESGWWVEVRLRRADRMAGSHSPS
jgi:hypothetical protein